MWTVGHLGQRGPHAPQFAGEVWRPGRRGGVKLQVEGERLQFHDAERMVGQLWRHVGEQEEEGGRLQLYDAAEMVGHLWRRDGEQEEEDGRSHWHHHLAKGETKYRHV